MTEIEMAWAAGLLEGEGCFSLNKETVKGKYIYAYPRITCVSTDLDVLERLQQITGIGRIGSPRMANKSTKPFWSWVVRRQAEAVELMESLHPHMGQRRQQKIEEILAAVKGGE